MTAPVDNDGFADQLQGATEQAKRAALEAITRLADSAARMEMSQTVHELRTILENLRSDTFKILVMGRFKNGKSTFLNAILGGTTAEGGDHFTQGPMVVDDLPATAILTCVRYAAKPYVTAYDFQNRPTSWTFERYQRESIQEGSPERTRAKFKDIKIFEMGFPARLCQAGIDIFDSPGLDEHPDRTIITKEELRRCDAAIVVYRSDVLMGHNEKMDAGEAAAGGARVFSIVNLMNDRQVDDRLRGYVWSRTVGENHAPYADPKDLTDLGIHFVNAKHASEGRYAQDSERFQRSGMAEFETHLSDFLINERAAVHIGKFANQALIACGAIEQHISQRQKAANVDRASLLTAYAVIEPRLAEIRERPARLIPILARARADTTRALIASFQNAIVRLRHDLPEHLKGAELPSSRRVTDVIRQKKLQEEASEIATAFVLQRIDEWSETTPDLLGSYLDRLGRDLDEEIAIIEKSFSAIHGQLTGWDTDTDGSGGYAFAGMSDRVRSAAATLLLGDVNDEAAEGLGGWRNAAAGVGIAASSAVLGSLASAFGMGIPLAVAMAVAAGLVPYADQAKRAVLAGFEQRIDNLDAGATSLLEQKIAATFDAIEEVVTEQVTAMIAEEERHLAVLVEQNQRGRADRDRTLEMLGRLAEDVAAQRAVLSDAVAHSRQP